MSSVVKRWRRPGLFLLGGLLSVCGPVAYAGDSVTSTCRQHPAYCTLLNGQEAGAAPTAQASAKVASIAATLRLLSPELKLRIERSLHECAAWADAEVNRQRLGGNAPSRQQCQEVLPTLDPCGQKVTRAMQWGSEKHRLATHSRTVQPGAPLPLRQTNETGAVAQPGGSPRPSPARLRKRTERDIGAGRGHPLR